MATKSVKLYTKPVFAKLTPDITKEEMRKNLIKALEKSGFTIKPSVNQDDKEGSS
jgi:dihydroorotate dehydrogenase